jgi:hypothetical protein
MSANQKSAPKGLVESRFGTRSDLVAEIMGLIDGDAQDKQRLSGTTNKKLLRIHDVATDVKTNFGGKSNLIDAIEKLQFVKGKANPGWRDKMETYTVKRLWDHHRQLSAMGHGVQA